MRLAKLLSLAPALAFLVACGDSPTTPTPVDAGLVPVASASANHPTGSPVVDNVRTSFSAVVPCMTFDMQIESVGRDVTQSWFYPNGNLRLFTVHRRQNVTFTNLSTGLSATNAASLNETTNFDESGLPTSVVINGAPQKIHFGDGGPKAFYHIGHWVFTFDFSVSPPVIEQAFSGRSNQGAVSGPCEALGDPAP